MVLGLIGKVGSGKSAVARYLGATYGALHLSSDDIAKEVMQNGKYDLENINAKNLFNDEKAQEYVRNVIHPDVINEIKNKIIENKNKYDLIVIESALPNRELIGLCDKTILIETDLKFKKELLKEHRDYDETKTDTISRAQDYYEPIYETANYKIKNDSTKEELLKKVNEVMNEIYIVRK